MDEKLIAQAEFCNLPNWWGHGFTGKGVIVWDTEDLSGHGTKTRERILQAAPDSTVINGEMIYSKADGHRVKVVDGNSHVVQILPIEDFVRENHIRILSVSKSPDPIGNRSATKGKYWQDLIYRYGLCIFVSSGNDGNKSKRMDTNDAWQVGAAYITDDGVKRKTYSNGGIGLDFTDFTGAWEGTSFSAPFLAGKAALLLQRFPNMTRSEMYEYMTQNCVDIGDPGQDILFGNGIFVLPHIEKGDGNVEITKTKVLVNGQIKEVKRVMVNNENYFRLRDFDDVLGVCKVDYDKSKNLPIINKV